MLSTLSGMVIRNFLGSTFFSDGPPPVRNGGLVVFWPVLGLGHLEKLRARAENRKMRFPGARGTFLGGNPAQKLLPKIAQLFYVFRFPFPRGGKSRNTGFLGHFGLGQPLALQEFPGKKRKNTISWVQLVLPKR